MAPVLVVGSLAQHPLNSEPYQEQQMPQEKTKQVTILKDVVGHEKDHFRGDVVEVHESFAHELIHSGRAVEGAVELEKKIPAKDKGKVQNADPK